MRIRADPDSLKIMKKQICYKKGIQITAIFITKIHKRAVLNKTSTGTYIFF